MVLTPVTSSNVAAVGYNPATKTPRVEFKNGGVYDYPNISETQCNALLSADSVGGYLAKFIKPYHTPTKVSA